VATKRKLPKMTAMRIAQQKTHSGFPFTFGMSLALKKETSVEEQKVFKEILSFI